MPPTWENRTRWPHFGPREMACQCGCGFGTAPGDISEELLDVLEHIRERVGEPVVVKSGARCTTHNADVGGVPHSAHTRRPAVTAADITLLRFYGNDRHRLVVAAVEAGVRGLGLARSYLHVDVDRVLPRPSAWTY